MFLLTVLPTILLSLSGEYSRKSRASSSSTSEEPTPPLWLTRRLEAFDLQVHDFPTTGRGLQTTRDRSPGQVLLKVPESEAVTTAVLLQKFPLLQRAVHRASQQGSILTDEQVLAWGLILLRNQKDPYVSSLPPQQYSVLTLPEPLLHCLPLCYQKLIRAYQGHVKLLHKSLLEYAMNNEEVGGTSTISEKDFTWAFATVRSRCVGMDGATNENIRTGASGEIRVLLPAFDLLNHQFGAQAIQGKEGGNYVVTSNDEYQAGDQVFISYSEKRDSLKMLMIYGFCPADNPQEVIFFDNQDILEACARARPQYFTLPVLQQLDGLFCKLGQQTDLYIYDGTDQQPRSCLSNSIDKMVEIERQFTTQPDPNFGTDLLGALLVNRKDEVTRGLERASNLGQENGVRMSSWRPMLQSISTLLRLEQQYLQN